MKWSLWVVEVNFKDGKGWQPTVGVSLSRQEGRIELERWRLDGRDPMHRLRKYQRAPK